MSLRTATRLARRELRGGLRGFRIFLACIILGVAAIALVGTIRESISAGLEAEGATLLGGDAEMEFTYRFANEAEKAWMRNNAERTSEIVDFRSMATIPGGERSLSQIKAVDGAYPLAGQVVLDPEMPLATALADQDGMPGAVMQPLLADRLGLEPGDNFRLGTQDFRLMARLINEPDGIASGFALGPRTIVATPSLENSGLLEPGTLFSTKYRLLLPDGANLSTLQGEAEKLFESSGMRWLDARNGVPNVSRFVTRLSAFLVLVGLSGLAVGGVGISAALRAFLAGKTQTIATLRTLGADQNTIFLTYFLQVAALAIVGLIAGLILGVGLPMMLAPLIKAALPVPAIFGAYPAPIAEAALYSALTILIFTLWPLARTQEVRAATLFRDGLPPNARLPRPIFLIATAALIATLLATAIWLSGNAQLTLWMLGGVTAALVLLALSAGAIRWLAHRARPRIRRRPTLAWALGAIGGPGATTIPVVLSLGLGLSVLAAIGQIDSNLRGAISRDLPGRAPSFFFVDLQKDQMPGFLERLTSDPAVSKIDRAPMLRGILSKINGRPAREVAGGHWVVEGDRGISYAGPLPERTTITEGEWWGEDYDGPPQISFAAEEASELGLKLGDEITVNILGRDIIATLSSMREVDFSTAGMGFVMVMNRTALEGAPHTFIATTYAEPGAEAAIMTDITNTYPNVTAIRVRDAVDRVADLLAGLARASTWGAAATLLTGFFVLIGAAAADQQARRHEAAVLKTLGATRAQILSSLALRALLLGVAAGVVALGAGLLGGWAVSHYIMETRFSISWPSALAIITGGIGVSLLAGLGFAMGPLSARPSRILRARD
ncbi:ABC transporter permease [Roseovarius aestuarii]|uniref:FtsX-like permease family protein n=1 Tax=Roseovarius aestuarii TaxID=475083 RepID=A0A1X7BKR5_9RHOB|nr:FtsX-like permease family protein [Roseovarius aestuarii]SMC10243.1 FtsX-like permease family protein [Roseovarius aestuarii]